MSGLIGKTTNADSDYIENYTRSERENQWGPINGEIVSFDPMRQTAEIKPLYKPTVGGEKIDMPNLPDVPIQFERGGGGATTRPPKAGDKVLLTPKMRSNDSYHNGGDDESGEWTRSFDLSDMEASLTGGNSLDDPIKNFDPDNAHIRFDEDGNFGIRGSQDGKIKIEGAQGNIYTLIAEFMELVAGDGLEIKTGSSIGTGIHALENKAQLLEIASKIRAMAL